MSFVPVVAAVVGAGASVYSTIQQSKSAEAAAKFNADQARNAAKVKAEDDRGNALRRQEQHRKYLAGLRARMLQQSNTIDGGDMDFLQEAEGNLQMRILDQQAASNRAQANYGNAAFRYDLQADQAKSAGMINTVASVAKGFNSVYSAGQEQEYWGKPNSNPDAQSKKKSYPSAI